MSSITTTAGSAGSNFVNVSGTATWSSTGNYTGAANATYAASGAMGSGTVTQTIDGYNFAPGVPGGNTIQGFQYVVTCHRAGTRVMTIRSRVSWSGSTSTLGAWTGSNADGSGLLGTDSTFTWGGSTDLAGLTAPSVSDTNSAVEGTGPTISTYLTGTTGSSSGTAQMDSVSQTVFYTVAASPPGTPTGLVASYASPTAVALNFTQGSGTVTDTKYRYSTDNSTWTTVDNGSAVTSLTISGLTTGQLYYFQVAASNSGGDSSYTASVVWVCGSNFTGQIGVSADDAFETGGGTVTIADPTDTLVAAALLGYRFENVLLAKGTPVSNAYVMVSLPSVVGLSGSITIDCELSTSSAAFAATSHNISGRTQTGTGTQWVVTGLSTGWHSSPNIAGVGVALLQSAWSSSDPLTVIFSGNSGLGNFDCQMQDGSQTLAPILVVFTGVGPVPVVEDGQDARTWWAMFPRHYRFVYRSIVRLFLPGPRRPEFAFARCMMRLAQQLRAWRHKWLICCCR